MGQPFHFIGFVELHEILGRVAWDEQDLAEELEDIHPDSIYYHTCSFFLRHRYVVGLYPNDFATWAAVELGDHVLGEKLGVMDPFGLGDLERVRGALLNIVHDHLSHIHFIPRVTYGEPLYFMRSRILECPTGIMVRTLHEFRDAVHTVDSSAIYYHTLDAVFRRQRSTGDFAIWLAEDLGLSDLAEQVSRLNPYMIGMTYLRQRLVHLCDEVLAQGGRQ